MSIAKRVAPFLRASAFNNPQARWLKLVPRATRSRLRLDPPPEGSRRVEIGSGYKPRPGYVHVDIDPRMPDLDLVARGEKIPLPAEWADEIVCVHTIEHIPAHLLRRALGRWHGLLRPGGTIEIHTPNGAAIGRVLLESETQDSLVLWAAESAVYGYWLHPAMAQGPEAMTAEPDHRLLFTFPLLRSLLQEAGFVEVEDVTGRDASCHHQNDWAPFISDFCLEIRARKPDWQKEREAGR